jgi:hypothetical protein
MPYAALADRVLVLHAAFVAFAVLGGLLVLRWPRVAWAHVPAAVWAVLVELTGWICPLTPLENLLREAGGQPGYGGAFLDHYLVPLLYPEGLTRGMQTALGGGLLLVNAFAYWRVLRRRRSPLAIAEGRPHLGGSSRPDVSNRLNPP